MSITRSEAFSGRWLITSYLISAWAARSLPRIIAVWRKWGATRRRRRRREPRRGWSNGASEASGVSSSRLLINSWERKSRHRSRKASSKIIWPMQRARRAVLRRDSSLTMWYDFLYFYPAPSSGKAVGICNCNDRIARWLLERRSRFTGAPSKGHKRSATRPTEWHLPRPNKLRCRRTVRLVIFDTFQLDLFSNEPLLATRSI